MKDRTVKTPIDIILEELEATLPSYFARGSLTERTHGMINHRTLTNKMSKGIGPEGFKFGGKGKVFLLRKSFLTWVKESGYLQNLK